MDGFKKLYKPILKPPRLGERRFDSPTQVTKKQDCLNTGGDNEPSKFDFAKKFAVALVQKGIEEATVMDIDPSAGELVPEARKYPARDADEQSPLPDVDKSKEDQFCFKPLEKINLNQSCPLAGCNSIKATNPANASPLVKTLRGDSVNHNPSMSEDALAEGGEISSVINCQDFDFDIDSELDLDEIKNPTMDDNPLVTQHKKPECTERERIPHHRLDQGLLHNLKLEAMFYDLSPDDQKLPDNTTN